MPHGAPAKAAGRQGAALGGSERTVPERALGSGQRVTRDRKHKVEYYTGVYRRGGARPWIATPPKYVRGDRSR